MLSQSPDFFACVVTRRSDHQRRLSVENETCTARLLCASGSFSIGQMRLESGNGKKVVVVMHASSAGSVAGGTARDHHQIC